MALAKQFHRGVWASYQDYTAAGALRWLLLMIA